MFIIWLCIVYLRPQNDEQIFRLLYIRACPWSKELADQAPCVAWDVYRLRALSFIPCWGLLASVMFVGARAMSHLLSEATQHSQVFGGHLQIALSVTRRRHLLTAESRRIMNTTISSVRWPYIHVPWSKVLARVLREGYMGSLLKGY